MKNYLNQSLNSKGMGGSKRTVLERAKRFALSKWITFVCVLCAVVSTAQNNLWVVGDNLVDFNNSFSVTTPALPQPTVIPALQPYVYDGQVAVNNQYAEYDQNGQLLFFIVDGNIYDNDGYMIADADDGNCDICFPDNSVNDNYEPTTAGSLVVTKVPGHCDKYYLSVYANIAILDLGLPNYFFPDDPEHMGSLVPFLDIFWDDVIYSDINFSNFFDQSIPSGVGEIEIEAYYVELPFKSDGGHATIGIYQDIYDDNSNGNKYLGIATDGSVTQFELRNNGAFYLNFSSQPITEAEGWPPYGALEYSKFNTQRMAAFSVSVAGTIHSYESSIFVTNLNGDMSIGTTTSFNPHTEGIAGHTGDLEFSANGRYLFYTIHDAPYLGVVDLQTSTVSELSDLVSISAPETYKDGRMEMNLYQGVPSIFYLTGSGLSILKGCDNLSTATFIANAIAIAPVPENSFTIAPFSTMYLLPKQAYKHTQQTAQSLQVCCQNNIDEAASLGYTQGVGSATWSYGNNPFGNTTSPVYMSGDLIFNTGSNITINGMEFRFGPQADVIIKTGAFVKLNSNSKWTSYECNGLMWPGVNLLGTTNAASSIDQSPQIGGDQGYLYMNNSTIEHATRAVEVGILASNAGGIIRSYNSTFRNNQYDVIFKKYHYVNSLGNYVQNKSLFNNCTFITNSQLNNPLLSPAYHAWLTEVDKIPFINCSFMNKTDISTYNWFQRGTGIYSSRASYTVDGLNDPWTGSPVDPDQTTFYKLQYGIRSFGYNNPLAFYTCKQQEFQFCLYGIVNYNTDNVQIYQNNFKLPDAAGFNSDETTERGIYLTNSTGYVVEQNFFDGFDDFQVNEDYPCALGVWVDNSGDFDNKIRNNDFDEMKLGTYVTRNNRYYIFGVDEPGDEDDDGTIDQTGLQLFCNTYTNGETDIFRDSETLMRQDQGGNQPGGFLNAGNRFSALDCNGAISDFVVDPYNNFYNNYWCHDQPNAIPDCGGTSNYPGYAGLDLLTISIDGLNPYDDADCPNTYGGPIIIGPNPGVISGLVTELGIVRAQLQSAKNTYLQVVDDNQKQSTLDILTEAFPHESQYYRDLLMQRYPLSADVIRKLIEQAPRLSPWHLTEVFLANSPLSKDLLYEIEQAEILSSFFMSFLYDADSGASLKRLMEMNMLSLATERDQLVQSIARAGLTYESDAESETDQPIYVNEYMSQLDLQSGASALRIRAAQLAANGDYTSALALVANEPLLVSYKSILEMEQSVAGDWALLSTAQTSALWDIYNAKKDYSSSMALSILQQIGIADFEPEPRVPIQYRSLQIAKDNENVALPLLGVWPNPATNSAWLHYPIEADEHATIEVYDPQGRLLNSFQPNTNGLVELSLKNYESGIYVVQLIAFDKVVECIKLTVVNQN